MAVKFKSNYENAQSPVFNTNYKQLVNQHFMLFQNFEDEYTFRDTAGDTKYFWFGGTETDASFDANVTFNRFYCVADFYITKIITYSTQIFNLGEEFTISFIGDEEGVLATCSITRDTIGYSEFIFNGTPNAPIQFQAGSTYYIQGFNDQYANVFTLYQITATAKNGIY